MLTAWLARVLGRKGTPAELPALHSETIGSTTSRAHALGAVGETIVAGEVRRLGWPVLRNLVLYVRGCTAEIDAIVLLDDALLVLEVKTLSGLVAETEDGSVWERRGRSGSVRFQSPLVQNRWHVDAVREVVGDSRVMVRGAVVSAGSACFSPAIEDHVVRPVELPVLLGRPANGARPQPLLRAWARLLDEARRSPDRRAGHRATMERARLHAEPAVRGERA